MPDDVGGRPFPDGDEPDSHSHGAADEEFATVVFDEDFVRAAQIHEPTAVERLHAAAQARAEAEASRARARAVAPEDELYDDGYDPDVETDLDDEYGPDADDGYSPYGRYGGALGPYRGPVRWHRPVAWVLAVAMGIGMVALAFAAVYRGASSSRPSPEPPPATSGVDAPPVGQPGAPGPVPTASASAAAPTASAATSSR